MDLGLAAWRAAVPRSSQEEVILLDTHALAWVERGHRRARPLLKSGRPLYVSPITMLELQMLHEAGRFELASGTVSRFFDDDRWVLDEPPVARWFETSLSVGWTRDPFDRLLVAHARMRGWRLATADEAILAHLPESERVEL
ncbi:MAG: PIN domain-containing protein [Vicinamibacterales bacterium]